MGKVPFERVLSLIERRKLFARKIKEGVPIVCKLSDGSLINFLPANLTKTDHLDGRVRSIHPLKAKVRSVVAMFYSGRDRYFMKTRLVRLEKGWRLAMSGDFYKLNRRENLRVDIPENFSISANVVSVDGHVTGVKARVVDFSAGGAKLRWPATTPLWVGSVIKGHIEWLKGKTIPFEAEVRHKPKEGLFGICFINLDATTMNRFRLMSIELQQMVNFI